MLMVKLEIETFKLATRRTMLWTTRRLHPFQLELILREPQAIAQDHANLEDLTPTNVNDGRGVHLALDQPITTTGENLMYKT